MKPSSLLLAAAVALTAAIRAEQVDVTFNAALTNGTGWAFNDNIKRSTSGEYYVNAKDALVTAPTFPFAVTSIVLRIRLTQSCTRNLVFTPITGGGAALDAEFVPSASDTSVAAGWNAALKVRSFTIKSTSGAYNLYLKSATIMGEPLVAAPGSLAANPVRGTSARISWTNPENAVSNRIDVFRTVPLENPGGTSIVYDFEEFSNEGGSPREVTDDFVTAHPEFAGSSRIYLPPNNSGTIQVSSDNDKGCLVRTGFEDCTDLTMTIGARVPNNDQGKVLGVGYENADGTTNTVANINLTLDFATNTVSLAELPAGKPLIINTSEKKTKRRVQIDYLSFTMGGGASTTTNLVKTVFAAKSPAKIDGLERSTDYSVTVTAFDGEGIASHPSSPLAFTTAASDPGLTISIR